MMETWERPQIDKAAAVCIPAVPGTYVLLLHLENPTLLQVGALGIYTLVLATAVIRAAFRPLVDSRGGAHRVMGTQFPCRMTVRSLGQWCHRVCCTRSAG